MNKSDSEGLNLLEQFSYQSLSNFFAPQNDFISLLSSMNTFLAPPFLENPEPDPNANKTQIPGTTSNYYPEFKKNVNYYHEFWMMYLQNELIIAKMKDYVSEIKSIQGKIFQYEEKVNNLEKNNNESLPNNKSAKKKNRRTAAEIEKEFKCPYLNCQKSYGSDVSLNLHIKLKHGGGNKTEREKLAKSLVVAKLLGENEKTEFAATFPPGYLENFYAFHKNKRKKNFDAQQLLKQCDINEGQKGKLLEFLRKEDEKEGDQTPEKESPGEMRMKGEESLAKKETA